MLGMYKCRPLRFYLASTLLVFSLLSSEAICPVGDCGSALAKRGKHSTVAGAVKEYGPLVRDRLKYRFESRGLVYPPSKLTMIGLKEERVLHIFTPDKKGKNELIFSYPIVGVSGSPGPKLKEGDRQIPEGIYKIIGFKPNSIAHLALILNYPNKEDIKYARQEKRSNLGSDIEIHGSFWSTGCLAMGDSAIEEIFILAHDTGLRSIEVILSPCNLNLKEPELDMKTGPKWLPEVYNRLKDRLSEFEMVKEISTTIPWNNQILSQ